MKVGQRIHVVQGFAEQYTIAQLIKRVLPFAGYYVGAATMDATLEQWYVAVGKAKARGYEVLPNPVCLNVLPDGRCGGCPND